MRKMRANGCESESGEPLRVLDRGQKDKRKKAGGVNGVDRGQWAVRRPAPLRFRRRLPID